jgi:hypothetical protein
MNPKSLLTSVLFLAVVALPALAQNTLRPTPDVRDRPVLCQLE